jgi:hypothetical protein
MKQKAGSRSVEECRRLRAWRVRGVVEVAYDLACEEAETYSFNFKMYMRLWIER